MSQPGEAGAATATDDAAERIVLTGPDRPKLVDAAALIARVNPAWPVSALRAELMAEYRAGRLDLFQLHPPKGWGGPRTLIALSRVWLDSGRS